MAVDNQKVSVDITANTAGLSQLNTALAGLQASLANLTGALSAVQGTSSNAGSALQNVAGKATETADKMDGMGAGVAKGSVAMSFLAGVAGGVAVAALNKLGSLMAQLNPLKFAQDLAISAAALETTASQMNMTAERAQALNDVIEDAELPAGDVTAAMRKLNMQLVDNEDKLNAMGIATRDSNGALVSQEKLFQNAVAGLMQYKEGTDRNAAAMEIFGRANIDLNKAMRVTEGAVDDSVKRMTELNNQFSPERMANAANYRQAIRDLSDVGEGLKNTIGSAVLPAMAEFAKQLADLGESLLPVVIGASEVLAATFEVVGTVFSEVGSILGEILSAIGDMFMTVFGGLITGLEETSGKAITWKDALDTSISVVKQAFIGFAAVIKVIVEAIKTGFDVIYNAVAGTLEVLVIRVMAFSEAAKRAMSLDFKGAVAAWDRGGAQIEDAIKRRFNNIMKSAQDFRSAFDRIAAETSTKVAAAQEGKAVTPAGPSVKYGGGGGAKSFAGGFESAKAEASAMGKARQDFAKASIEYSMKLFREQMRSEENELKRSLDSRSITNAEYFSRLSDLKGQQIDAEMRAKEAELNTIREAMDKKGIKLSEMLKLRADELKVTGDIHALEIRRADTQSEIAEQARKAAEQIDKQRESLQGQIAAASGIGILESKLTAIARKFAELPKELMDSAEARTLQTLETMKARLEEFDRKQKEQSDLEKSKLDALRARGGITEEGAKQRLLKLERELLAAKLKNLEAELATARAAGDPIRVQMIEKEIAALKLKNEKIAAGAEESKQVTDALSRGFDTFFTDILNGTKSVKDAFKDLAGSIVSEINSIIAKKLSSALMESLSRGAAGAGRGGFDLSGILTSFFGGGSSGSSGGGFSLSGMFGGIGSSISNAFSGIGSFFSGMFGGFASGGYAMAGQPYMVGENGPELFIPGASGQVMPNDSIGGFGGTTVVQNISTPDANSFRRASQQVMVDYQRALMRAGRRNG